MICAFCDLSEIRRAGSRSVVALALVSLLGLASGCGDDKAGSITIKGDKNASIEPDLGGAAASTPAPKAGKKAEAAPKSIKERTQE